MHIIGTLKFWDHGSFTRMDVCTLKAKLPNCMKQYQRLMITYIAKIITNMQVFNGEDKDTNCSC